MKKKIQMITFLSVILVILGIVAVWIITNKKAQEPETPEPPVIVEPEPDKITSAEVLTLGDLLYHEAFLKDPTVEAFERNFKYMKQYFQASDLVIGNYETTTNPNKPYSGYPLFNTPEAALQAIKNAGINVLNTNNNHSMDSQLEGVKSTLEFIRSYGIKTVGTNLEGESKRTDLTVNEIKVGLLSYSYGYNGFEQWLDTKELTEILSIIDEDNMKREIEASKAANDVTFVIMHWGYEYHTASSEAQKALAQKLAEWGVDVVIGAHPHVVQETAQIDKTFVIYSMGNFVSNQRLESLDDANTEQGLAVQFKITKNHTTNVTTVDNYRFIPTWVYRYKESGNQYYEVIPAKDYVDGTIKLDVSSDLDKRIRNTYDTIMNRVSLED